MIDDSNEVPSWPLARNVSAEVVATSTCDHRANTEAERQCRGEDKVDGISTGVRELGAAATRGWDCAATVIAATGVSAAARAGATTGAALAATSA